jgi:hypothetical protein
MEFKLLELVVILGALALIWRSASRLGAEAEAQKKREAGDDKRDAA